MNYIDSLKDPNNKCQREDKIIKFRRIILIGIIALITISSYNSIFNFHKSSKVIEIQNNFEGDNLSKVNYNLSKINYIEGKLIWDNETFQDQAKIRKEIKKYNNIEISFKNKNDFLYRQNPLISLVITIFNQENKIKSIYASILNQDLKDIEIIFVDDASTDNSSNIIKYLMKYDNRIVYLKNDINKRAFYSRYKGVKSARGEYVLVIDPDDLLLTD